MFAVLCWLSPQTHTRGPSHSVAVVGGSKTATSDSEHVKALLLVVLSRLASSVVLSLVCYLCWMARVICVHAQQVHR